MTDIPANVSTTATVSVGSTTTGTLESVGDRDWYRIDLTAGQSITVTLNGVTISDPYLYIRDSAGNILFQNDDLSGSSLNSQISFHADYTGAYYIDAGAFQDAEAGDYQIVVTPYTSPPLATNDQIADQLVNGYWGGDSHHWDVTQGGTITVNISTLNAAEQTLARAALAEWSDIIGVHFQEVTTGGDIVFDDSEDPSGPIAATDANWSSGIITSAHVQISTSWVNQYGTGLDSYSFQTYVHEIGHALGLGHAGDYNGDARYPYDARFENDAWSTSVMSYFSQHDNSYFFAQGFSEDYAVTPMLADILAMQQLYGLSTTTRTGDTTYGYNSNAGGVYNASLYPHVAYTIFDSGGTDTLDFSGSSFDQLLNLNPETFSNVNGDIGNLTIARGVVIENAIGGSGNDTIIGNGANNVLSGGAGYDTISYETATAGVTVNLSITTAQDTGGAGIDALSGFEKLIGSSFGDVLTGGAGVILLLGEAGDDVLVLGPGPETADGGTGFDTVDCSQLTSGVQLAMDARYGTSPYSVGNVEKIIGTNYADTLVAGNSGGILIGGAGDDTLQSPWGNAQLAGGAGNDTYTVNNTTDQIIENAREGTDLVIARGNFTLGANLENLTLLEANADPYAGAGLPPGPVPEDWNGTGNDLANLITGNDGANVLSGLGGADTLIGGAGADTLYSGAVSPAWQLPFFANNSDFVAPVLDHGSEVDTLNGGPGVDRIYAGYGDIVDGGADLADLLISFGGASSGVTVDFLVSTMAAR